jgi:nucleoside-diphosphate-sugar epimerase
MRVLVTGATGFLGQQLVHELLAHGMDVRCLVRGMRSAEALAREMAALPGRLTIVRGSLAQIGSRSDVLGGCEVLFHVAAAIRGAPAALFLDNVTATRQLIREACRSGVRRLVLVSSLGVYGTAHLHAGETLDESCAIDPEPHLRDAYSFSKIAQERVAWDAHRSGEVPLVVIRPGVIYGPGRDCLGNRVGLRLGSHLLRMGGSQRLPYTFVRNCARALFLAGTVPSIEGEAFNIVDDTPPSARELLGRYRREVQQVRVIPVPYRLIAPLSHLCEWYHTWSKGQLPAVLTPYKSAALWKPLHYANRKAKAILGWRPDVEFADGLRETFRWLREQKACGAGAKA